MKRIAVVLTTIGFVALVSCSVLSSVEDDHQRFEFSFQGDPKIGKNIFVFLDGTKNDATSTTNVWWMYDFVAAGGDKQATGLYIPGVGTDYRFASGAVLGRGMEDRIVEAYEFISKNFRHGDKIFLFGFSRGAHQARAVAGLISYVGIPPIGHANGNTSHDLVELLKKEMEEDYETSWKEWAPEDPPILGAKIKDKLGITTTYAEIQFLGLWDTVPGSSFKSYEDSCKENIGPYKTWLWWLPGIDRGERYKSDNYPTIKNTAHAVSRDENRSKFAHLPVCKPIGRHSNQPSEVWFPGAHSDVGGGYENGENKLPDISLAWMLDQVKSHYEIAPTRHLRPDPKGLAHFSICDSPGNSGSSCEDRVPAPGWISHPSIGKRENGGAALIDWDGKSDPIEAIYPIRCGEESSKRKMCRSIPASVQ